MTFLKLLFYDLFELLFPRLCLICGHRLIKGEDFICTKCRVLLPYTFFKGKKGNPTERLLWGQMKIERASSYCFYTQGLTSNKYLYALKYNHNYKVGVMIGKCMAQDLLNTDFFNTIDLLIPVPLAPKRKKERGFNQSEAIAQGIKAITHIPINTKAVKRVKETSTQTKLSPEERIRNVQNIFQIKKPEGLQDKHILLIDDVLTTGSTIASCGRVLEQIKGIRISVLTVYVSSHINKSFTFID